jgi:hypothetical protein
MQYIFDVNLMMFIHPAVKPRRSGRGYKADIKKMYIFYAHFVEMLQFGVFWFSIYSLIIDIGAPPQLAAK